MKNKPLQHLNEQIRRDGRSDESIFCDIMFIKDILCKKKKSVLCDRAAIADLDFLTQKQSFRMKMQSIIIEICAVNQKRVSKVYLLSTFHRQAVKALYRKGLNKQNFRYSDRQ